MRASFSPWRTQAGQSQTITHHQHTRWKKTNIIDIVGYLVSYIISTVCISCCGQCGSQARPAQMKQIITEIHALHAILLDGIGSCRYLSGPHNVFPFISLFGHRRHGEQQQQKLCSKKIFS